MNNLGSQLKALRKSKGLTLEEAGKICGCSRQAISQYEQGERNMSLEKLKKIVEALGGKLKITITIKAYPAA